MPAVEAEPEAVEDEAVESDSQPAEYSLYSKAVGY